MLSYYVCAGRADEAINNSWIMSWLDALMVVVIHDNVHCASTARPNGYIHSPHLTHGIFACVCLLPKLQFTHICVFRHEMRD